MFSVFWNDICWPEGREIRDQRATHSTAARVICTAVAAVMELRMYCQRCYVRYVLRTVSTAAAAQRATYTYVFYSRTCNMYSSSSSSSCDGATHVLSTLLRTVCTTCSIFYSSSCCSLTFLRSYAVGHRITICSLYSQSFCKLFSRTYIYTQQIEQNTLNIYDIGRNL